MKKSKVKLTCPVCRGHLVADVITGIDLERDHEAIADLRTGRINRLRCTLCGHKGTAPTPITVRHTPQKWVASYMPVLPARNRMASILQREEKLLAKEGDRSWKKQVITGPQALGKAWPDASPERFKAYNFLDAPPPPVRSRLLAKIDWREMDDLDQLTNLGMGLYEAGDWRRAIPVLEKAMELQPDQYDVQFTLGSCHFERREFAASAKYYDIAARRSRDGVAYYVAGVAHMRNGDLNSAHQRLKTAVKYDPEHADAHYYLACTLAAQGRNGEAIDSLRSAVYAGFDSPDTVAKEPSLSSIVGDKIVRTLIKHMEGRKRQATRPTKRQRRTGSDNRPRRRKSR